MFFFVINWKLSPHKIDFSGLHKERRLEKFQNYRAIVLFRVRGPIGSCLCSLVSMNDISSYLSLSNAKAADENLPGLLIS